MPYTLVNAPNGTTLQVSASFAPFYSDTESAGASVSRPIPRFISSGNDCGGQSCLNITPDQAPNSGSVQGTLTEFSSQSLAGAQVLLRSSGTTDILGTNVSNPASNVLTATFDLANVPVGAWDVIITPATGSVITLPGGFSVLQAPACAYSVGPQSVHAPATGGGGTLVVTPSSPQCSWGASTTAGWITLGPASPLTQSYSIGPNLRSSPLTGSILVAGESIPVTQDAGGPSCTYVLNASTEAFPVNGGSFTVNVTAPPGCGWNTVSYLNWVSFPNGSSLTGSGSVTIQTAASIVGFQSGMLTIAGQPFQVTQAASACGGTEFTGQVTITAQALLESWFGNQAYWQEIGLTNTGGAITGPVSVVFRGLCTSSYCAINPFNTPYSLVDCSGIGPDPAVVVAPNGLAAGQSLFFDLTFVGPGIPFPSVSPSITFNIVSGTPGQ